MDPATRKRLEEAGWTVGDTREFLDLTEAESTYIDIKLSLARGLREGREARGMTQVELANLIGSSQSRVAKMEAADSSVSVDLLIRSLLTLGASDEDLSRLIQRKPKTTV